MRKHYRFARAFTLPTVMITSLVMLTLLLAALQLSTAATNALQAQYYNQLAREAAESGARMVERCLKESNFDSSMVGKTLTPKTNCTGGVVSGANDYVYKEGLIRTTFSVVSSESEPGLVRIDAVGMTERSRASDSHAWKTYTQPLRNELTTGVIEVSAIASGVGITCAIFDGETWCFGRNEQGQLGLGADMIASRYDVPKKVLRTTGLLEGKIDKLVGVGDGQVCIVTTDNEIYCSGQNISGKLGVGKGGGYQTPVMERVLKPVDMQGEITRIVHGVHHTCVISGGVVWCWGANDYGQLGNGDQASRSVPARVVSNGSFNNLNVTDLHTVPYAKHTCAVEDGKAYCWGRNSRGQLGNNRIGIGALGVDNIPVCSSGTIPCNSDYDGVTTKAQPVFQGSGVLLGKTVVSIRTSMSQNSNGSNSLDDSPAVNLGMTRAHTCVLTTEGKMYCWGSNSQGQLGGSYDSTWENKPVKSQIVPRLVGGVLSGKNIIEISLSHTQTCALTQEGASHKVYCWGSSQYGKLGNGGTELNNYNGNKESPTLIAEGILAGKSITSLMGAINRTCVIADQMSYCWGRGTDGQIGDGKLQDTGVPTEATLLRKYRPSLYY